MIPYPTTISMQVQTMPLPAAAEPAAAAAMLAAVVPPIATPTAAPPAASTGCVAAAASDGSAAAPVRSTGMATAVLPALPAMSTYASEGMNTWPDRPSSPAGRQGADHTTLWMAPGGALLLSMSPFHTPWWHQAGVFVDDAGHGMINMLSQHADSDLS